MTQSHKNKNAESASGTPQMTDKEFRLFSKFIYNEVGINIAPAKKLMLSVRLNRRLKALGLSSYQDYYDFIFTSRSKNEEITRLIDVVTTNKTEFFRENKHFPILSRQVLPELVNMKHFKSRHRLHVWCAGCSTGEEAYTLAIVLEQFFQFNRVGDYHILATDISTRVLAIAKEGIYSDSALRPVTPDLKRKYFMKGKKDWDGFHRVVPELRKKITFRQLNFMDDHYHLRQQMDVVFCRNVVIYFDRPTQIEFFAKLYRNIVPGGYLFIGSSETLFGINDQFVAEGPTVYRRPLIA